MNIGIFTTLKVKKGVPLFWGKHHKRLVEQSNKLNLGEPNISLKKVQTYLNLHNLTDCALKITVIKQNNETTVSLQHRSLPSTSTTYKLITCVDTRNYRKIYKTTDRTINEQAKKLAEEQKADDALFTVDGNIIESTIANIFSLDKNGEIITPPIKARGLNGIIRQVIIKHAKVMETDILENTRGPLVLVNSLRVQKVSHLNGKKLLNGQVLLQKLKILIENAEEDYLATHSA